MCDKFVLAMYDVRGKQDYIFRGNKIKEIVGGSLVIRDIYKDYLLTDKNRIVSYSSDVDTVKDIPKFTWEEFKNHINNDKMNGEVIYDGGGNFLVLFKNKDTFNKITHRFTYDVLKNTASLRVIGTCVEIDGPGDYRKDQKALYKKHRITEGQIQNVPLCASLPISMVSTGSSLPIVYRGKDYSKEELELTKEQLAKYKKYKKCLNNENDKEEFNETVLDNIAPEKGIDSHIAVIYIDGNSMGAKVEECTKNCKTYEDSIKALREFSWKIQKECIDSKKEVVDKKLKDLHDGEDNKTKRRLVIGAGDEINLVVAGTDAYEVAKAYLEALGKDEKYSVSGQKYSSCAGIAVFKSHMPYSDAYRIAEECCESGKNKMKITDIDGNYIFKNTSFLDFHLCQGAIDVSLDQIRRDEETENISRPWLVVDHGNEIPSENREEFIKKNNIYSTEEDINKVVGFANKIGHGNVKGLLSAANDGPMNLEMELKRIKAHQKEEVRKEMKESWEYIDNLDKERRCKLIYDVVLMYDMWFKKGEAQNDEKNTKN